MDRLIKTSLLLAAVAVVFYVSFMIGLNKVDIKGRRLALATMPYLQKTGGYEAKMFGDLLQQTAPEVVVIGSSHAYRGYDPRIFRDFGLEMINTGTSSQHSLASYLLLREYWNYESCPLYLIDVYPQVYMGDGIECTNKLIQNVPSDKVAWQLFSCDPDMRTFNAWMARQFCDLDELEFDFPNYLENGYWSNSDTLKETPQPIDSIFSGSHIYFDYLHRLLTTLESRGCQYILINQPMPQNSNYLKFNEAFNRSLNHVLDHRRSIYRDYLGMTSHDNHQSLYLDMSQDPDFDICCDFSDANHLNQAGVEKFNRKLMEELRKKGFFSFPSNGGHAQLNVHKSGQRGDH